MDSNQSMSPTGSGLNFAGLTVLCVGDVMLDRFVYGEVERISPEAPVPVLRLNRTREMLGGAGNVANNIASLGGRAILIGLTGDDATATRLAAIVAGKPSIEGQLVTTHERPTICKTRLIAANQQVVRTDEESRLPLTRQEEAAIMAAVRERIGEARAVVLADYGKGVLNSATTAEIIALAREVGAPTFVDPKSSDFTKYRGATCITPNRSELAAASGMAVDSEDAVAAAARRVLEHAQAEAILATRSEKGMMLIEADGAVHSASARARDVFDVSGAGDTVIAAMALCRGAGRPLAQAMHIANAAASVVVSKFGTATASLAEVIHELDAHDQDRHPGVAAGAQPLAQARELVASWKEQGLTVGFTNGCFDILHPGHVSLLAQARAACDRLVVALNSDASVRRLKGAARPINPLEARASVIAALRSVDCVVSFDEDTPLELITAMTPDVLVKGADYTIENVVGADHVRQAGGRVVLAKFVPAQSTTATVARMREAAALE